MTINKLEYTVKRSNRKTLAIRLELDGAVTVLAPINAARRDIENAVINNAEWISKKSDERRKIYLSCNVQPLTDTEIADIMRKASTVLPERVAFWADKLGVDYNFVTAKLMLSRWGSCSTQRNISLNSLLMLAPDIVKDYIIVHELSHIKHMDHSKAFYAYIDSHFEHRKECQRWLKTDGVLIISRARRKSA